MSHNARTTSPGLWSLIRLDLEVGGIPVCLGTDLGCDEWFKACQTGGFSRLSFLGKLLSGAGMAAGTAYAARNQDLSLFGGKVLATPDLYDGPVRFGTSATAFFRSGTLYRLAAGVTGNRKAASHFARQCTQALLRIRGDPGQRTGAGTAVWTGKGDRLTLLHTADAFLVHELVTG